MADKDKHIITRYDDAGRYLGWGGEYYATAKSAQAAADELNANLAEGDYLWAPDTEAKVAEYRAAYGEGTPEAPEVADEPATDEPEATDEAPAEEATESE